jgi:glyoxylase-like metal-dependent hydrolase (beta-lactamase superfamily II)
MNIKVINTGFFKLDGGAMFGVVPKSIWSKVEPADDNNMCTWAMRCLLIETENRKILIDTGIGNKQSDKFFAHYHLHGQDSLVLSLALHGLNTSDITDVLLTHLHFDHVGGAVQHLNNELLPTFQNATYWSNKTHFDWAANPNDREKASFLTENFIPLQRNNSLQFLDATPYNIVNKWLPSISLQCVYGHTEAMMLPHIHINNQTVVYCADLIPSPNHIPLPYVMGYDMRPLQTMTEKNWLLQKAADENYILFFEHDKQTQACTVSRNEKGKIIVDKKGNLADFIA